MYDVPVQMNLLGISTVPIEQKKKRNFLSVDEKIRKKEKSDAHRAWKLYKSQKYDIFLTKDDKCLLKKYYGINIE